MVNGGDHQGGTGCSLIISIGVTWFGNVLTRRSRGVVIILLHKDVACRIAALMECVSGAGCILVQDCRTQFLRCRWVGGRDVSIWSAEDAIIRKVSRIAFIAVFCADSSFAIEVCQRRAILPMKGLYHIVAA